MHLAGKADAGQPGEFGGRVAADRGDRGLDPLDPVGLYPARSTGPAGGKR